MATTTTTHERAGSYAIGLGGLLMRECSCGATFTGGAEETFEARDAHIAQANEPWCSFCGEPGHRIDQCADRAYERELYGLDPWDSAETGL